MSHVDHSMSLTPPAFMSKEERIGAFLAGLGVLALLVAFLSASTISPFIVLGFAGTMLVSAGVLHSIGRPQQQRLKQLLALGGAMSLSFLFLKMKMPDGIALGLVFGVTAVGAAIYSWAAFGRGPAGIKNNGIFHSSATRQAGVLSWMLAIVFTGFYVVLYWFPDQLFGLVAAADPLYHAITGNHSYWIDDQGMGHVLNQWFVYGLIYTVGVIVMGYRYILKYRHSNYQVIRTLSVAFFQLVIAFTLPHILERLNTQQNAEFKQYVQTHYLPVFQPYDAAKNNYFALEDSVKKAKEAGQDAAAMEARLGVADADRGDRA